MINNIDDNLLVKTYFEKKFESLFEEGKEKQDIYLNYQNTVSKLIKKLIMKRNSFDSIMKFTAISLNVIQALFQKHGLNNHLDVLIIEKFGMVRSKNMLNFGLPISGNENYYEDIDNLKNTNYSRLIFITKIHPRYVEAVPLIKKLSKSGKPGYSYDFDKQYYWQGNLPRRIDNIKSNRSGFIVINKNDIVLSKIYYEHNDKLLEKIKNKSSTYLYNILFSPKGSIIADTNFYRCIEHTLPLEFSKIITLMQQLYNSILESNDDYEKIIATIKLYYWQVNGCFYIRGAVSIAEIILNGLLKYILDDDFFLQKKSMSYPYLLAILEPDEDFFCGIFFDNCIFDDNLKIKSFKDTYIKKRKEYCRQFNTIDDCWYNSCWFHKDTKMCDIKYK